MQLRCLAVCEWKNNPQDYEGFVPGIDIVAEAEKFKQSGYFFDELGNEGIDATSSKIQIIFITPLQNYLTH